MVIAYDMSVLPEILSSKIRAEIFRILFGVNQEPLHVREIERRTGFAIGTIQTELKKLYKLDLLLKEKDGNRLYYRANQQHPIFGDIRSIVLKTVGIGDILRGALAFDNTVSLAFVFGSIARGTESSTSDIDLMVVGELGLRSLTQRLQGLSDKIGREINPYAMRPAEFRKRAAEKEHFLSQVLKEPKLFIIGNHHDLESMA